MVYLRYIKNYFIFVCFHSRISDFVFPFMNIKIFQIEHRNLNFFNNLIKEVIRYVKGHGKSYLSRTVQIAFFLVTASNITNEAPAFENAGAKIKTNINKEGWLTWVRLEDLATTYSPVS